MRAHLARCGADVVAAAHRLVDWLLDPTRVVLLATTVNHHLKRAVGHRRASHRGVDHHGHLVLAVIQGDHRVHRAAQRRAFSRQETGGRTEGANQDALVVACDGLADLVGRVGGAAGVPLALDHLAAVGVGVCAELLLRLEEDAKGAAAVLTEGALAGDGRVELEDDLLAAAELAVVGSRGRALARPGGAVLPCGSEPLR